MANDAAVLLIYAGKKAGNVFKSNQWNIEAITKPHKPGTLNRSVNIQNSGEISRLVRDYSDRLPAQTGKPDADIGSKQLLNFKEVAVIDD